MKIWDKADEVIGVAALTSIACYAMSIEYNGGVVTAAVTGIIALLAIKEKEKRMEVK